ncbi:hypothetical protein NJ76_31490 [Rhodococcus sp. IITR03]|nr:hypothetical protein NJ76_31490 [Rhodococcus sp. IITR03]
MRDDQHGRAGVVGQQVVAHRGNTLGHLVEALAVRGPHGGVAEPAPVQFGVATRGLGEGETLPVAEIRLDEPVVHRDREIEGVRRCGGRLPRAPQR